MTSYPPHQSVRRHFELPDESMISPLLSGSLKVGKIRPRQSPLAYILVTTSGIKAKVENRGQYHEYLRDLEPIREELGVDLKEELYPEASFKWEKSKE